MTLDLVPIDLATAKRFVAEHHRHNDPPARWRFGVGIADASGTLVGVAVAGNPVARKLGEEPAAAGDSPVEARVAVRDVGADGDAGDLEQERVGLRETRRSSSGSRSARSSTSPARSSARHG